jgi:hypothetical protein
VFYCSNIFFESGFEGSSGLSYILMWAVHTFDCIYSAICVFVRFCLFSVEMFLYCVVGGRGLLVGVGILFTLPIAEVRNGWSYVSCHTYDFMLPCLTL